jgi:hypothetical protein
VINIYILPVGVVLRFLLLSEDKFVIGFFDLSDKDRTWTFKYSESFEYSGYLPLNDFPLIRNTYGHQSCVKLLLERVRINDQKKCLDLPDAIFNGKGKIGEHLQLHIVQ